MSRKVPVAPIGRGLNDAVAPTEQPQGTYREGFNVRGIDPRTGRVVWGAQRAGLSEFGDDFDAGFPTHFCTAFKLRQQRTWVELTNTTQAATVPSEVQEGWTLDLEGAPLDVSVGPDGQAYYLLESGDVSVVNQKGREVEVVRSAARNLYLPVPRIEVAEDGSIFVAETNERDDGLPRGYLSRWIREEDKTWRKTWETEFTEPLAMFGYNLGALYVALEPQLDENDVLPPAELVRISQPLLGPEVAWVIGDLPRPILDVTVNDRGQALVSCPSNADRAVANAGFGTRQVDWTPSQEVAWDLNGWAWVDAFHVNESSTGLNNGETVTKMRDRRFEETTFDVPDETSPVRELNSPQSGLIASPKYDATAFGGLGGIQFTTRTALVSQFNNSDTDQRENEGLIPSGRLSGTGSSYICAMIVQFSEDQMTATTQRRILSQQGPTAGTEPSWEMITDSTTGSRVGLNDLSSGTSTALAPAADATTRVSILSWYHDDNANTIDWYHDGSLVGTTTATVSDPEQGGEWDHSTGYTAVQAPGPWFVMGGTLPNRINLARAPGTVTWSAPSIAINRQIESLYDGVRAETGTSSIFVMGTGTAGANAAPAWVQIDFGSNVSFDSISLWQTFQTSGTFPSKMTIAWSSSATGPLSSGAVPDGHLNIEPVAGSTNDDFIQDAYELATGGTPYRYLMIALTNSGYNGGASVIGSLEGSTQYVLLTEIEVFFQNLNVAGSVDDTAEFTLGEFVAKSESRGATDFSRQRLEGYLAHRFGVSDLLNGIGHPHDTASGPPAGAGSSAPQDRGQIESALRSTDPILAKYGVDGQPIAAYAGAGVGLGAAVQDDQVYAIGEVMSGATPNAGEMLSSFTDNGYSLSRMSGYTAGTLDPAIKTTRLVLGPQNSVYVPYQPALGALGANSVRRYNSGLSSELWSLATTQRPNSIAAGGFGLDESDRLGPSGQEFLYAALDSDEQARRIDTLGLQDTGQPAGRDPEYLAVLSTGSVVRRRADGSWEELEAGALTGDRPGSATLFGNTFIADGLGYRVYNHATGQLRDFENAVKGEFPPRCRLIAAYNSRLVVAGGDNAFTVYQSRFGDPFDFDYGPELQSISQAIAGTTASQGNPPEPITALMPFRDARLYIGTSESLFVQLGDLADGGRLEQLDKSQGVAFGYAWCESPMGIYYFSSRGGVMLIMPNGGLTMVSSGAIQRRLEEIDLTANRIDLAYNWIDKAVHVFVIPNGLGSEVEHFVYEEPTRAWHKDTYGGGIDRAVTTVATQVGDTPEDRALFIGFGGGYVRRWDQYAQDDAGEPVHSSAVLGPLMSPRGGAETRVRGLHGQLASDQGPVEVAVRGSESADAPGPPGPFQMLAPGRGLGAGVNVGAPAVFVEVRGTGRAWAIHELTAEVQTRGAVRSRS